MKPERLIEILRAQEDQLWHSLENAKLVFGEDSEAAKIARARWSTTLEILSIIENENA